MSLKEQLEKLKQAYVAAGLNNAKQLQPPVPASLVRQMERQIGQKLPPELKELYFIHGGQRYFTPGITGVFGKHRLLPTTIIVRDYLLFTEQGLPDPLPKFPPKAGDKGSFHPTLIPFAAWGARVLCIDNQAGRVWEFEPQRGLNPQVRYPSIEAVAKFLLRKVEAGEKATLY